MNLNLLIQDFLYSADQLRNAFRQRMDTNACFILQMTEQQWQVFAKQLLEEYEEAKTKMVKELGLL